MTGLNHSFHSYSTTSRNQIRGLTTAAGLWTCACLGISIGLGFYTVAIGGCLAIMLVLFMLPRIEAVINNKTPYLTMHVEFEDITERVHDYSNDKEIYKNCYNIITVDKAKGLEFEKVVVIEKNMTRNQLYVACTRAINELMVVS